MLTAEMKSTTAKPRMIFARNRKVGKIARFDFDAIRSVIPAPNPCSCGHPPAVGRQPPPDRSQKLKQNRQGAVNSSGPPSAQRQAGKPASNGRLVAGETEKPYSSGTWLETKPVREGRHRVGASRSSVWR